MTSATSHLIPNLVCNQRKNHQKSKVLPRLLEMEYHLILPMMWMNKMYHLFDHFLNLPHNISNLLPQNVVDPSAGSSGAGHGAANSAKNPSHLLTSMQDLLQVINIVYQFIILTLCQDLFVDEL